MSKKAKAKQTTQDLFKHLDVAIEDVSVKEGEDGLAINITVPEEDSGLLIGYHGETLNALQNILGQIINQEKASTRPSDLSPEPSAKEETSSKGGWLRVIVNVNDYRDQREQQLKQMAQNAAERAKTTGDEIEMPYLTAAERRIIHLTVAEYAEEILSYSEGEGRYRRLIVAPSTKSVNSKP